MMHGQTKINHIVDLVLEHQGPKRHKTLVHGCNVSVSICKYPGWDTSEYFIVETQ